VEQLLLNLAKRDRMRAGLLRQMEKFPVLLMPPCGVTAFPHRSRRWKVGDEEIGLFQAMMPATPFNLLGLPAVVIPFGMSADGLPIGVQLVGRPYEEELILELAVRLENARGPFEAAFTCHCIRWPNGWRRIGGISGTKIVLIRSRLPSRGTAFLPPGRALPYPISASGQRSRALSWSVVLTNTRTQQFDF
jgi:hypothetical protein